MMNRNASSCVWFIEEPDAATVSICVASWPVRWICRPAGIGVVVKVDRIASTTPFASGPALNAMTDQSLHAAFAGESQAAEKYMVFAEQAEDEGYPQVAKLFRAISFAETRHARNHL